MGVFKEEIIFLEELAKKQKFIWNDSNDIGVHSSEIDINRMREVITTLLELPGSKLTWKADKPCVQRQYHLIVMWSLHSDERVGGIKLYDATQITLLYFKGRGKEFFSINPRHVFTDKDGNVQ